MKVLRCNHTFNHDACSILLPKNSDFSSKQKGHLFKILYDNDIVTEKPDTTAVLPKGPPMTNSTGNIGRRGIKDLCRI